MFPQSNSYKTGNFAISVLLAVIGFVPYTARLSHCVNTLAKLKRKTAGPQGRNNTPVCTAGNSCRWSFWWLFLNIRARLADLRVVNRSKPSQLPNNQVGLIINSKWSRTNEFTTSPDPPDHFSGPRAARFAPSLGIGGQRFEKCPEFIWAGLKSVLSAQGGLIWNGILGAGVIVNVVLQRGSVNIYYLNSANNNLWNYVSASVRVTCVLA